VTKDTFIIILLSACLVAGCIPFFKGVRLLIQSLQNKSWPVTEGVLLNCELVPRSIFDGGTSWEVKVRYAYFVDGVRFEGATLATGYGLGFRSENPKQHQQIYERLSQTEEISISYNPEDPTLAVIYRGPNRDVYSFIIFGFAWFVSIGIFAKIWFSRP
jgi:hypothetical protein